ncbi:hypothetical protein SRHO_G00088090 [Serrasalmus rhombeus]
MTRVNATQLFTQRNLTRRCKKTDTANDQWQRDAHTGQGPPVSRASEPDQNKPSRRRSEPPRTADTGLHYDRYLREVVDFLEKDPHFREKLRNTDMEDIKQGKLAKELNFVSHHVRTKLDELKRQEATHDLENYDQERHEEFKKYEMMKEHERRERLKTLDEETRKKEEKHYEEMKKKHADHPKINHPGSQDQLKEVWEEADGLDPDDFDPKTFFSLHDSNGDGYFDEQELEALFTKELEKIYDPTQEEDDMVEMEEERLRMREHVMNEVDTNKDRLVSLEEFMIATMRNEFKEQDAWETLEQNPVYTEEEMREFEEHLAREEKDLKQKTDDLQKQKEELQRQQQQLETQKLELQQAMEHMERIRAQKTERPAVVKGHSVPAAPLEEGVGVLPGNNQPLLAHYKPDVPTHS